MARTSAASVRAVLLRDYDTENSPSLDPFIDWASAAVDRVSACAARKGVALSASELELLERWLAAHAYAMSDQPFSQKRTGDSSGVYQGQTGMSLDATKYGQQALVLDASGCLAAMSKRQRAGAAWLGKPPSGQVPYRLRE